MCCLLHTALVALDRFAQHVSVHANRLSWGHFRRGIIQPCTAPLYGIHSSRAHFAATCAYPYAFLPVRIAHMCTAPLQHKLLLTGPFDTHLRAANAVDPAGSCLERMVATLGPRVGQITQSLLQKQHSMHAMTVGASAAGMLMLLHVLLRY